MSPVFFFNMFMSLHITSPKRIKDGLLYTLRWNRDFLFSLLHVPRVRRKSFTLLAKIWKCAILTKTIKNIVITCNTSPGVRREPQEYKPDSNPETLSSSSSSCCAAAHVMLSYPIHFNLHLCCSLQMSARVPNLFIKFPLSPNDIEVQFVQQLLPA